MSRTIKYLTYLFICLTLVFCSTIDDYTSGTLSNQGILPLSTSNSYLGTNLYLAKQAEQSQVLYNFLESKGGPIAIELIDEAFKKPRLLLYYPKTQEAYSAELEDQSGVYEWIVRGPYAIKRSDYNVLSRIQSSNSGDPIFVFNGKFKRFKVDRELALATPTPLPTLIPTPLPTPRPTPKKLKPRPTPSGTAGIITAPKITEPSIKDFKPLNSDQQAIQMSKGFAERSDTGDVIHTVKADGESISAISKWYTGSDSNVKDISSANSIPDGKALVKGQRIKVPLKLLKNLKAMP